MPSTKHVSTKVEETRTEKDAEAKKKPHKEETKTNEEEESEVEDEKNLITKEKGENQSGSTNIFNSNIDFGCASKQNSCEWELNFLQAWISTPCLDKICIEGVEINVEGNLDDENINEIFGVMKIFFIIIN